MVGVLRRNFLWALCVTGILVFISLTCAEGSSIVSNPDKAVNGFKTEILESYRNESSDATFSPALTLDKTSYSCRENSTSKLCSHRRKGLKLRRVRSGEKEKMALSRSVEKEKLAMEGGLQEIPSSKTINNDYMPIPEYYQPYGYHGYQDASEGRGWLTIPLFFIFSIIQFKLVSAIFLALFGPMILFLIIVQGFLFKATLILLGMMMT